MRIVIISCPHNTDTSILNRHHMYRVRLCTCGIIPFNKDTLRNPYVRRGVPYT